MPTTAIGNNNLTLMDLLKRQDPDGSIAPIVEVLTRTNAFIQDASFMVGNQTTGHKFTARTGLPSIVRRKFNEGVPASKSKTDQITETCTNLNGRSVVDEDEAAISGNAAAFRASEDTAFVQKFNNEAETAFVYDSPSTDAINMTGIIPRYSDTSGPAGKQIILHDSSPSGSDQTSILLVGWGPESVFGIVPKGMPAGFQMEDRGKQDVQDANGNTYVAWVTWMKWYFGLVVKDYRKVVRIANIDTSQLSASGGALIDSMISAYYKLIEPQGVRLAWYCNRLVAEYLHKQARSEVKNSTLSWDMVEGRPVLSFMGAPIRVTDAITNTESIVA